MKSATYNTKKKYELREQFKEKRGVKHDERGILGPQVEQTGCNLGANLGPKGKNINDSLISVNE